MFILLYQCDSHSKQVVPIRSHNSAKTQSQKQNVCKFLSISLFFDECCCVFEMRINLWNLKKINLFKHQQNDFRPAKIYVKLSLVEIYNNRLLTQAGQLPSLTAPIPSMPSHLWFTTQHYKAYETPFWAPRGGGARGFGGREKIKIILKNVSPISTKLFFVALLYFFSFTWKHFLIEEIETVVKQHGLLTEDESYLWPLV